jgi:hypothetical protein
LPSIDWLTCSLGKAYPWIQDKGFFFRDPHILIRLDVGARVAIRSYPRHLQVSLNVLRERKTWGDRAR